MIPLVDAAGAGAERRLAASPAPRTSLPLRHSRASGTTKRAPGLRPSGTTPREGGRDMRVPR